MAIARITGPGLVTIAALVLSLWACILVESKLVREASLRNSRTLIELRHLREGRHAIPVSMPSSPVTSRAALS